MTNNHLSSADGKADEIEFIDLSHYFKVIKRSLWRILALSFALTTLAALISLTLTPQYSAKVSILIAAEQSNVLSINEVYGLDSNRRGYFETQYEILRSRQIAARVVDRLNLQDNEYFNNNLQQEDAESASWWSDTKSAIKSSLSFLPQEEIIEESEEEIAQRQREYAIMLLMDRTQILPMYHTQVVEIAVQTPNAKLSADLANNIADVYIENYLVAKLEMTEKATKWLNESLQGLRANLDESERKLAEFDESKQLVNINGVVSLASDELQQLSDQLIEAQVALKRDKAIYEQVNRQGLSVSELSSVPEVLNHPSIQSIKTEEVLAQSKVSELREVYGPKHPVMIAANAELSSIQLSLDQQIRRLVSGITSEYRSTEAKVIALQKELSEARADFRALSSLESQRKAMQRDLDINQQLYDSFFTRLKETDQLDGFESTHARILDEAKPPLYASAPQKRLIVMIAFVLSMGLGVTLALVLDAINSGIRSAEDVERKLSQRMLGIIPWQVHRKKQDLSLRHYFDPKQHVFSEAVRTLRTGLQLLNLDRLSQTVLVTSSVPEEGKSTVSINLAFALGQLEKVLLIDTDLRRPTIAKQFSLPGFQPGVSNVVSGSHNLDECIVTDEESNIDILCAGTLPPNPQELLASNKFAELMHQLREKYTHIIIDSAPTLAVSDAIIVSKQCDSLVYVVRADHTSDKTIKNGLSRYIEIGQRIDGIVLNQVDIKKANHRDSFSGYYDQYGYNNYHNSDGKS